MTGTFTPISQPDIKTVRAQTENNRVENRIIDINSYHLSLGQIIDIRDVSI